MSRRRSRRIGEAGDELGNTLERLAELQRKPGWNIGEEMGGDRREDGMRVEEAEEQMREEGDLLHRASGILQADGGAGKEGLRVCVTTGWSELD